MRNLILTNSQHSGFFICEIAQFYPCENLFLELFMVTYLLDIKHAVSLTFTISVTLQLVFLFNVESHHKSAIGFSVKKFKNKVNWLWSYLMYKIVKIPPLLLTQKFFIAFPSPLGEGLNPTSNKNTIWMVYTSLRLALKAGYQFTWCHYRLYIGLQSNAYNPLYICIASGKVRTSCLSRGERAVHWDICHAKLLVTLYIKFTNF